MSETPNDPAAPPADSAPRSAVGIVTTAAAVVCGAIIVVMMLHVILDVALRTLFNSPLPATLEIVANWWMVAIAFLGLGFAKIREEHISVTLLAGEGAPEALQRIARIVVELITLAVLGLLIYFPVGAALDATARGQQSAGVVPIPTWPARYLIPIGALLFAAASQKTLFLPRRRGKRATMPTV